MAERGITLETVVEQQRGIRSAIDHVASEQIAYGLRLDRYGSRLRALERKVGPDDFDEDTTGQHRVQDTQVAQQMMDLRKTVEMQQLALDEHRKDRKESGIWWSRQRWIWTGLAGAAVFAALLSGCVGLVVWWVTHHS